MPRPMLMWTDYPDITVLSSRWFLFDPICTAREITPVIRRNNGCIEKIGEGVGFAEGMAWRLKVSFAGSILGWEQPYAGFIIEHAFGIKKPLGKDGELATMVNPDDSKIRKAQMVHERARYIRGRFLNFVAVIERDIALIITDYFCPTDQEKRELFFTEVISRVPLGEKREILFKIIRRDYPRYWDKNRDLLKEIIKIQELRNKLAHSIVDISEQALDRPIEMGIGFVEWEGSKPITEEDFQEWECRANMVLSTLSDIKRLLPFKETPVGA